MTKPFVLLSFLCVACTAEVGGAGPPPGDPEVVQSCDDPRYDDGVCSTDLACEAPDIDCFRTFADDAAAAVWYAAREATKAQDEGRPARALLAPSDPRFVELRALLDAGWQAFRTTRPVGLLGDKRPALVVIDDAGVNAFVTAESATQKQVFCVMVHTGLLAAPFDDDGRLGVLLHELQHIVGTHGIPGVDDALRLHYVAGSSEPIGRFQTDDPIAHTAIEGWLNLAADIGPYSQTDLGGFPYKGLLWGLLDMLVDGGMRNDPDNCERAAELVGTLRDDLADARDPLDDRLTIDPASVRMRASEALGVLRDECMRNVSMTFVAALADLLDEPAQDVAASLSASDLQLVSGKHVVNALTALVTDRRNKMRALEGSLPQQRPWTAARYFTDEEDADDVAVLVLRDAGRNPESYATALVSSVAKRGADAAARCNTILDGGAVPPYGVDLLDTHHASCWRAAHALQIAKDPRKSRSTRTTPVGSAQPLLGLPQPRPPELVIHE